jgi:hypothetical protein
MLRDSPALNPSGVFVMCLNKKVLIGLGVLAVGLVVLQPGWALPALPFLILAVCPLSMIFMMRGMRNGDAGAARNEPGAQAKPSGAAAGTAADLGDQVAAHCRSNTAAATPRKRVHE